MIDSSAPTADFYFLVILSTLIVAMGILANNIVLVIGGMLVTPLLSPLLAIAMGLLINNNKVIIRSVKIFLTAFIFAFIISFFVGLIAPVPIDELSYIHLMRPSLMSLLIAFVAGIAASYAWVKPGINDNLPGIAVTVTLIPPLTSIGLALSKAEWAIMRDAFSTLCINILGIVLASFAVFSLMDFYRAKEKVLKEIKEEEKEIKKAQKEAEKEKLDVAKEKLEQEKKKLADAKKELDAVKKKATKK
ncbi:DUF389 domain-containing protein [Patescibacteria group bacterium]